VFVTVQKHSNVLCNEPTSELFGTDISLYQLRNSGLVSVHSLGSVTPVESDRCCVQCTRSVLTEFH
jgi:hypothetical protein